MAIEMKVPSVGESITEVTIASWTKKNGDFVKRDEIICELESDKATFELPAESEGILEIVANAGDTIPIGGVVCRIVASATPSAPAPVVAAPVASAIVANVPAPVAEPVVAKAETVATKIVEATVPPVGESITEVTLSTWSKKDGDAVKIDEIICELESDKATFEFPSPATGILRVVAAAGSTLAIGGLIAKIETGGAAASAPTVVTAPAVESASKVADANYAAGHPSPVAAKVLAEKGIDPASVQGSGVGGRITKDDAVKAVAAPAVAPAPVAAKPAASAPVAVVTGERTSRTEKMTSLRKTIARRLVAVKNETAMLTTFNEVDMKPIMELRAKYKDKFKETHGVGLGFMSFFTRACAIALKEFPAVNAYIDGDSIVYNDFSDISIAVSSPRGLVVPVIRNAEKLDFAGIEAEVVRLAVKAKEGKLTLEEMSGGTFTITNGGIFGSMLSTPIINAPQSAILGMHNIVERPVAINGEVVIRPIMYVALSYDHRTIDGKESVGFLVRVKQLLEDPMRMLLSV
jgi:2-oxoglutarate dehydrogenase E2 component (dihydrolipoamide succinyltransferase)